MHFHGIGDGDLSVTEKYFVELLDYLVANRDKLWVGTAGEIYKYQREYEALNRVCITDGQKDSFRVLIECDEAKIGLFNSPFTDLYDEPLTVRNEVTKEWSAFFVRQGKKVKSYSTIKLDGRLYAQYDLMPNVGEAIVTRIE